MSTTAEKIVTEALSLSPHARAFVAERLIESLDASPGDELSPAWRDEVRRRVIVIFTVARRRDLFRRAACLIP